MHSYVKELEGIYSSNGLITAQQVFVSSVRDVLIKAASEYEAPESLASRGTSPNCFS